MFFKPIRHLILWFFLLKNHGHKCSQCSVFMENLQSKINYFWLMDSYLFKAKKTIHKCLVFSFLSIWILHIFKHCPISRKRPMACLAAYRIQMIRFNGNWSSILPFDSLNQCTLWGIAYISETQSLLLVILPKLAVWVMEHTIFTFPKLCYMSFSLAENCLLSFYVVLCSGTAGQKVMWPTSNAF